MAKPKKKLYTTPVGVASWPWLNRPDTKPIKGKPQKPAYKVGLLYGATDPAWLKLKELLDGLVDAAYDKAIEENPKKKKVIQKAYPYADEMDDEGNETGKVRVNFKQNAEIKDKATGEMKKVTIPLFDAKGRPSDAQVYGGSHLIVSFSVRPYLMDSTNNAGISMDLAAVQVIKLVSSSQRSADSYGFGAVEGGYEAGDDDNDSDETSTEEHGEDGNGDAETDPTDF